MPAPKPTSRSEVALVDAAVVERVDEGQRDRGRRRVAGVVQHRRGALHRDAEALAGGLDDADVGLVGNDQRDVVGRDAGVRHRLLTRVDHDAHGPAEHLSPVHLQVAADLGVEEALGGAVGVEVPPEELAGAVHPLEHDGARAVGEEDGGVAVLPVGDAGQRVGADQRAPCPRPWRSARGPSDQPVDETGAGGVDVEGAAAQAELGLHGRRGGRDRPVGRGRGEDERVDLARVEPRPSRWPCARTRPRVRRSCRRPAARWMPVRSRIHSSVVSIIPARSSLVRTFGGSAVPQPVMTAPATPGRDGGHVSSSSARRWAGGR